MFDEVQNIILNLNAGLLPEHLTETEIKLLEGRYGSDWFEKLGYDENKFKKPANNEEGS